MLRFSPAAARWVADEEWHPEQRGQFDKDGYYRLEVPYSQPTELLMDVLRHSHHVEVLEPAELRAAIEAKLEKASRRIGAPRRNLERRHPGFQERWMNQRMIRP